MKSLTLIGLLLPSVVLAQPQYWITVDKDSLPELKAVGASLSPLHNALHASGATLAQLDESQVNELSRLMHEEHQRCGGYIVHASYVNALAAAQAPISISSFDAPPIGQDDLVNDLLPNLDKSRILSMITTLSNFTNRYYTTSHGVNASDWIRDDWTSITSGLSFASVSQYNHSGWAQDSVIAELRGSEFPDEVIVIGGHLDSTVGFTSENTVAPGADDDASGIATLTEVMRVIANAGHQPKRTIRFMGYAAEEVGLRGSGDIASNYKNSNVNVVGVLQLDMTNYNGSAEDIVFMTDYTDASQNAYLQGLLDHYLPSINYSTDRCGYGCSDHASWHNNNFPASMPFEARMSQYNRNIHTRNDTLANMDTSGNHALNFAKLALTYALELANPSGDTPPPPPPGVPELDNGVPKTGLSGERGGEDFYRINVPANRQVTISTSGGSGDADLYVYFGSKPTDANWECRPYRWGNSESCSVTASSDGYWYIRLKAYQAYSGVTLSASY